MRCARVFRETAYSRKVFGFYLQLPVLTNAQNVPMLIETNLENAARSTLLELTKRTQRRVACARAMGGGEPAAAPTSSTTARFCFGS